MIKVTVHSADVRSYSGNAKATGKPFTLHFQTVFGHFIDKNGNPSPYPEKFEIIVERDERGNAQPYAPGEYQLHPSSLYLDRRGDLAVAPRLIPLRKAA